MSPLPRRSAIAGLCGAALLATGVSSSAAPGDEGSGWISNTSSSTKACFQARRLEGFAAAGRNTVNLRAFKDVYQMTFLTECWTLEHATTIAVQSRSGTDFICSGADAELVTRSPIAPAQHCVVKEMRKLSLAEIDALPRNQRP